MSRTALPVLGTLAAAGLAPAAFAAGSTPYGFDFTLAAVPEPARALLLLAGAGTLVAARRRAR